MKTCQTLHLNSAKFEFQSAPDALPQILLTGLVPRLLKVFLLHPQFVPWALLKGTHNQKRHLTESPADMLIISNALELNRPAVSLLFFLSLDKLALMTPTQRAPLIQSGGKKNKTKNTTINMPASGTSATPSISVCLVLPWDRCFSSKFPPARAVNCQAPQSVFSRGNKCWFAYS